MTYKNERGSAKGFILILLGAVLVAGSLYYLLQNQPSTVEPIEVEAPIESTEVEAPVVEESLIDLEAALSPRYLGTPSPAAAKILEFSSLSCGHCAKFHNTTLKDIQVKYIDTGKVYFQYVDFPLNKPALEAAMIARCLPEEAYVPFTTMLFEKQEEWAYGDAYRSKLMDYATDAGMSGEVFRDCINNEELQKGIIAKMQAAQKQWNVSSTPTFIVNNADTVVGSQPIETFEKTLDVFFSDPQD